MPETNAAERLIAKLNEDDDAWTEVSFKVRGDAAKEVPQLLHALHCMGSMGCSRSISIEEFNDESHSFFFDGDGSDKLDYIQVNGKIFKGDA